MFLVALFAIAMIFLCSSLGWLLHLDDCEGF